jgi:hypothetical protein
MTPPMQVLLMMEKVWFFSLDLRQSRVRKRLSFPGTGIPPVGYSKKKR